MAESLRVRVISAEATVFEGEAEAVVAPAWDGRIGILSGHAPLITLLGAGELNVDLAGGGSETFHVAGGALKVEENEVTVLTEFASSDSLDAMPPGIQLHSPEDTTDLARGEGA